MLFNYNLIRVIFIFNQFKIVHIFQMHFMNYYFDYQLNSFILLFCLARRMKICEDKLDYQGIVCSK